MTRRLFILFIAASVALPAAAQSRKKMQEGRERDWDHNQVQRWLDFHGTRQVFAQNLECEDFTARRDAILNGNRITTQISNFGSISAPGNTITNVVWNGLGYGYEFGPFVGAEIVDVGRRDPQSVPQRDENDNVVLDARGDTVYVMHIISDGLVSLGGEVSPDGKEYWGWQPIPCAEPVGAFEGLEVVDPNSDKIPTSDDRDTSLDGKPDSWPDSWYNPTLRRHVWPGALQQGASNADKEALYFMNDYSNREFAYYPFSTDSTKRGLGLELEVRLYQWANPLAEDAIFLIYKITNKSEKDLEKVVFGMWGDPHIGGASDWHDDLAFFDRDLNMVYAWDADGRSSIAGRAPGYLGYMFLESPGIGNECIGGCGSTEGMCLASGGVWYPGDGIDNDNDGMVDESWTDCLDNDGDWDPEKDDVGLDGIPNTGDPGEGDGVPTPGDPWDITKPGEPNFSFTDIDESDMIGLTSFASPPFAGNSISNDERVWDMVRPGRFDEVPDEPGDYVFLYGSGYFPLRAGQTKRFSIALILGENREDLFLNAQTVRQIFDVGYRFAKPPEKPNVTAVPGDRKVTLYWDDIAEHSVDPLNGEQDFEGYVIYRSTDHEFSDQQTITDINGSRFLFRPLEDRQGVPAKFDLKNGLFGPSPIPYVSRGVTYHLGNDTGLRHSYVDSNNVVNGQRYYYAVVAYDRGFTEANEISAGGISPSETSKTITYNPVTDTYIYDVNTVSVVPRPRAAGYVPASIAEAGGIQQASGAGTGRIDVRILNEMAVPDANPFRITFERIDGKTVYSVIDEVPQSVEVVAGPGKSSLLGFRNVIAESFVLRGPGGQTLEAGTHYELDDRIGSLHIQPGGAGEGERLTATFTYAPIFRSANVQNEESNPVFDGMHLFLEDHPLRVNHAATGWAQGGKGLRDTVSVASAGPLRIPQPFDYEIRFSNEPVSTGLATNMPLNFRIFNLTRGNEETEIFVPDTSPRDGTWNHLTEPIIIVENINNRQTATWQVRFTGPEGAAAPGAGDVLFIRTDKPFTPDDVFTFETRAARVDADQAAERMRDIYVVPNPYVATNELEPRNPISNTERGDRRLYFANLPAQATIRIYSLAGELVDIVEHNSTIDDGKAYWDLRTIDNMSIAYGLYVYHVDAPEGTFIGKFAVIK